MHKRLFNEIIRKSISEFSLWGYLFVIFHNSIKLSCEYLYIKLKRTIDKILVRCVSDSVAYSTTRVHEDGTQGIREYVADGNYSLCPGELHAGRSTMRNKV